MFYRQRCFNSQTNKFYDAGEIAQSIEPLIGLLRDPFSVCPRIDESKVPSALYDGAILLSRRFLLLSIAAPVTNSPPGLGTSNIMPWMYDRAKKDRFSSEMERKEKRLILLDLGSSYFVHKTKISVAHRHVGCMNIIETSAYNSIGSLPTKRLLWIRRKLGNNYLKMFFPSTR